MRLPIVVVVGEAVFVIVTLTTSLLTTVVLLVVLILSVEPDSFLNVALARFCKMVPFAKVALTPTVILITNVWLAARVPMANVVLPAVGFGCPETNVVPG